MLSQTRTIALLVAAALFMQMLDNAIVNTAIPTMAKAFGVQPLAMTAGITVYMLTMAVFIPIAGWMADRLGARQVFLSAIVVFTLGSLFCGISQDLGQFILSRIVQGIGGAFMVPVGQIIVLRSAERGELLRALSLITWPALFAPVLGPTIGGFITTYLSWRWNFFINIPLGLIALVLVPKFIPDDGVRLDRPLDWPGFILSALGMGALLSGLDGLVHGEADLALAGSLIAIGAVLCALAVRHMFTAKNPLLDFAAFRVDTFALSTLLCGSYYRVALNAMPFLLPLLFQVGFGLDPFQAGSLMMAYFAGNLGVRMITTPVFERLGFRTAMFANGLLSALGVGLCAALTAVTPAPLVIALLVFGGATRSLHYTGLNVLAFIDIQPEQRSSASTLATMLMQITILMGVVVGSLCLNLSQALRGAGQLQLVDFQLSFIGLAGLTIVSAFMCLRLRRDAGHIPAAEPEQVIP